MSALTGSAGSFGRNERGRLRVAPSVQRARRTLQGSAGGLHRASLKLGHRDGDAAELAIIELVDNRREIEAAEAAKKRAKAASSKKKASKKAAKSEPTEDASESTE
jgi:hypothetical protein